MTLTKMAVSLDLSRSGRLRLFFSFTKSKGYSFTRQKLLEIQEWFQNKSQIEKRCIPTDAIYKINISIS